MFCLLLLGASALSAMSSTRFGASSLLHPGHAPLPTSNKASALTRRLWLCTATAAGEEADLAIMIGLHGPIAYGAFVAHPLLPDAQHADKDESALLEEPPQHIEAALQLYKHEAHKDARALALRFLGVQLLPHLRRDGPGARMFMLDQLGAAMRQSTLLFDFDALLIVDPMDAVAVESLRLAIGEMHHATAHTFCLRQHVGFVAARTATGAYCARALVSSAHAKQRLRFRLSRVRSSRGDYRAYEGVDERVLGQTPAHLDGSVGCEARNTPAGVRCILCGASASIVSMQHAALGFDGAAQASIDEACSYHNRRSRQEIGSLCAAAIPIPVERQTAQSFCLHNGTLERTSLSLPYDAI